MPRLVQPHIPKGSIAKLTHPHISLHDGFLLRPWEPTDADAAMAAFADADIQRWHSRSITQRRRLKSGLRRSRNCGIPKRASLGRSPTRPMTELSEESPSTSTWSMVAARFRTG